MPAQDLSGRIRKPAGSFVSPLCAGLAGLPPLYIQARSDETSPKTASSSPIGARQAAADARVDLFPGQQHTFQMAVGRSKDADEAMRWPADLGHLKLGP